MHLPATGIVSLNMVGATTISTGPFDAISGIFETLFWLFFVGEAAV